MRLNKENLDSGFQFSGSFQIAYILEKFPSPTEHFILNEIHELEKKGLDIQILVLRKQKKYINLTEAKNLKSSVIYLPKIIFYFPFISLFFPLFTFRIFQSCKKEKLFSPIAFKYFPSLPKFPLSGFLKHIRNYCISLFFAYKLKGKAIRHIHAHFAFIGVDIAYLLAQVLKVKFSTTVHAQDIYTNKPKIKKVLDDAVFTITCTKYNSDYLNKITDNKHKDKIFRVYHGIDTSKWLFNSFKRELNTSGTTILSIARLVEKKGLIYLIEAIRILNEEGRKVICTIIGEGPLKKQLEAYIKINKLKDYVQILDFVSRDEVITYLTKSDIFVLPCIVARNGDRDGLPNVILEAMTMGIPVVSTSVSAIPEVIKDNYTGILVNEKDERDIVNAIKRLVNDRALYTKISENAMKKVEEEFNSEKSIDRLIEIFRSNI